MSYSHQPRHTQIMEVDRVKSFSDSIFAFAMTLLVARISIPDVPLDEASTQLPLMLFHQWRYFAIYAISFLSIGGYWVLHHSIFTNIHYTDKTLIWLNLMLLLSVTFLPYPTALMGKYGRDTVTALVYGITISLNYAMLFVICKYAYSDERLLKPAMDQSVRLLLPLRLLIPLMIALCGTALAFFYFRLGFLFYFLVVLVNSLPLKFLAKRVSQSDEQFIQSE